MVIRVGLHPVVVVVHVTAARQGERLHKVVVRMVRGIHQRQQMYSLTQVVVVVVLVIAVVVIVVLEVTVAPV
tara:strand:- start:32 stop:247 length:216 start_codon:yes stop_codon:yes gene_type:complete